MPNSSHPLVKIYAAFQGGNYTQPGTTPEEMAISLLKDLRHFCDANQLNFDKIVDHAYKSFINEKHAPAFPKGRWN